MRGLLTLLWHGPVDAEQVLVTCGGGMGSLLGPADGLYHDLGVRFAEHGIGTIRVGLPQAERPLALRARRDRGRRPRRAARRAALRRDGPLVRRRGRDPDRRRAREALSRRGHALDAVGRVRGRVRARARRRSSCSTAPATRSCRPRRARSCDASPATARSCCSRAPVTCSPKPPTRSASVWANGSPAVWPSDAVRFRRASRRSGRTRRCSRRRPRRTRGPTARGGGGAAR